MSSFLLTIISLSFSGSILIVALLFIKAFSKHRLNYRWQYYIWMIAIVRLLLPFSPENNLMNYAVQDISNMLRAESQTQLSEELKWPMLDKENAAVNRQSNTSELQNNSLLTKSNIIHIENNLNYIEDESVQNDLLQKDSTQKEVGNNTLGRGTMELDSQESNDSSVKDRVPEIMFSLCVIYLTVVIFLFGKKLIVYLLFVKNIRKSLIPCENIQQIELLGQLIEEKKIKKYVDLCTNAMLPSPMLIGFLHPVIALPEADMSGVDYRYTLEHELTHLKRKDLLYKWLIQITLCIHWFNPLVYVMAKEINRICELSCDERVILALTKEKKQEYGETLLHAANRSLQQRMLLPAANLYTSKELLRERLEAIMEEKKLSRKTKVLKGVLTTTLCVAGILLGSFQVSAKESHKDAAPNQNNYLMQMNFLKNVSFHPVVNRLDTQMNNEIVGANVNQQAANIAVRTENKKVKGKKSEEEPIEARWSEQTFYMKNYKKERIQATKAYFAKPYLIKISWNLGTKEWRDKYEWSDTTDKWLLETYKTKKDLKLEDKSSVTVSFTEECKEFAKEKKFDQALLKVMKSIKTNPFFKDFPLTYPLVVKVQEVSETNYNKLAEEFYQKQDVAFFQAIFPVLDEETQEKFRDRCFQESNIKLFDDMLDDMNEEQAVKYLKKAYQEDKISFFRALIDYADESQAISYAKQAYKDKRIKFFTSAIDCVDCDLIAEYARKSFKEKQLDFFSVTMDELSCEELAEYAKISYQNKEFSFFSMLLEYLDDDEIDKYLLQSYKDGNLKFYTELIDYADDEPIISCAKQAYEDKKEKFFENTLDYLDCDELEDFLEQSFEDEKVEFFRALLEYADEDEIEFYWNKAQKQKNESFMNVLKQYRW